MQMIQGPKDAGAASRLTRNKYIRRITGMQDAAKMTKASVSLQGIHNTPTSLLEPLGTRFWEGTGYYGTAKDRRVACIESCGKWSNPCSDIDMLAPALPWIEDFAITLLVPCDRAEYDGETPPWLSWAG